DLSMSGRFAVQSYLDHQAGKLVSRFDACTYVLLTDALNRHDVGLDRGGVEEALRSCPVPCVVGGVSTDRLYPLRQQEELAALLPGAAPFAVIDSPAGHDGFLTEDDVVGPILSRTLELAESQPRNPTGRHARTTRYPHPVPPRSDWSGWPAGWGPSAWPSASPPCWGSRPPPRAAPTPPATARWR